MHDKRKVIIKGVEYEVSPCKNCEDVLCDDWNGDFCCDDCEKEYWEEHPEELKAEIAAQRADDAWKERGCEN